MWQLDTLLPNTGLTVLGSVNLAAFTGALPLFHGKCVKFFMYGRKILNIQSNVHVFMEVFSWDEQILQGLNCLVIWYFHCCVFPVVFYCICSMLTLSIKLQISSKLKIYFSQLVNHRDDPHTNNKSLLKVPDDLQLHSVAKSLRESTNGM